MEKVENNGVQYGKPFPKLVLSHFFDVVVAGLVGGIFMASIGSAVDHVAYQVFMQIISMIIFIAMIYSAMWHDGDRDRNLVDFHHIEKDMLKGLKVGLIAMIPAMLTSILLVLSAAGVVKPIPDLGLNVAELIYRIINFYAIHIINAIIPPESAPTWGGIVLVSLIPLIIPLANGIAYVLGYNRIALISRLVYKGKDKKSAKIHLNGKK